MLDRVTGPRVADLVLRAGVSNSCLHNSIA